MIAESVYYNGFNSLVDFGVTVKERVSHLPQKKTIRETLPFMNGSYDLSSITGEEYYSDRTEDVTFNVVARDHTELADTISLLTAWIGSGGLPLRFATEPGRTYQNARPDVKEMVYISPRVAELTVTFTCAPYILIDTSTVSIFDSLGLIGGYIYVGSSSTAVKLLSSGITVSMPTMGYFQYSSTPEAGILLKLTFPTDVDSHRITPGTLETSVTPSWEYTIGQIVTAYYIMPPGMLEYGDYFTFSGYYQGITMTENVYYMSDLGTVDIDPSQSIQGTSALRINGVISSMLDTGYNLIVPSQAGTDVTQLRKKEVI